MGKVIILSFSDKEEDVYQSMLQVVSNSRSFELCNLAQSAEKIQMGKLKIDLCKRNVSVGKTER